MAARVFADLLMLWGVVCRPSPLLRPHRDVVTTQGAVRGYLTGGVPHFAYFGLPYARPPTHHDRFKAPKPPPNWDGIFEATHKIKCPQAEGVGEENCLVANVFATPQASSLPVLVIVHGGAFQSGWGHYHPPERLLSEGFVITTFNYRIGALGFLCLGTQDTPGNAGLKDLIAALYWINRNIASFGGDPNDVIIYGSGSGAAAVQFLLLSGLVKGLFHKVILESGSVLSPASISYEPILTAFNGANAIGYEGTDDPNELLEFYQITPAKELIDIPDMFLPCVENESFSHSLIDSDPVHILKQGKFDSVPMLVVFNDNEGISLLGNETEKLREPAENFKYLLPNNLEFDSDELEQKVGEIVNEFYFGGSNKRNTVKSYADYIQDVFSEYPIVKFAMLYSAKSLNSVYIMKINVEELIIEVEDSSITKLEVLDYFYKENLEAETFEKLLTLWSNFMKMSDPTPLTSTLIQTIWQPVITSKDENLDISEVPILQFPKLLMLPPPSHQRILFWDNIYNRFYKPHVLENGGNEDLEDDG